MIGADRVLPATAAPSSISFKGGRTQTLALQDALRYISIEGSGDYFSLMVSAKDPSVTQIIFEGARLAQKGTDAEFEKAKSYLPTFERLPPVRHRLRWESPPAAIIE